MKLRFLFVLLTTWLALPALAPSARAQGERPSLVEYSAPIPECASSEAFQTLVRAEMTRSSDVEHGLRFALRIRRIPDGRYEGTLTTETGVRHLTASRCDEVTASLAVIIAMAEPSADVPARSTPLLAPAAAPGPASAAPRSPDSGNDASPAQWRVGARGFATNHPSWGTPNPGVAHGNTPEELAPTIGPTSVPSRLTFVIVDTQACLLDVPIGESGFNLLGCLRVAGGTFSGSGGAVYPYVGLALWGGLSTAPSLAVPHSTVLRGQRRRDVRDDQRRRRQQPRVV